MKPNKLNTNTDGLEWLRTIRADIQREIGAAPQQRAAYYQQREKTLKARLYHPRRRFLHEQEPTSIVREEPPTS